jgi:PIN domain nuclease of toxin-antitoxin system
VVWRCSNDRTLVYHSIDDRILVTQTQTWSRECTCIDELVDMYRRSISPDLYQAELGGASGLFTIPEDRGQTGSVVANFKSIYMSIVSIWEITS